MKHFQIAKKNGCAVCGGEGIVWVEEGKDAVMHRCGFCESGKDHALQEFSSFESFDGISLVKKEPEQTLPKLTLL